MITTITNDQITFQSDSRNVEPLQLRFNDEQINYFWRPRESGSAGTSTCFPLLGMLPGDRYFLDGKTYAMGIHGFVDQLDFSVQAQTDRVTYQAYDDPNTRAQYPYAFRLQVTYALEGNELVTEYSVYNPNSEVLPFSIGGHPRLSCPMDPEEGLRFEDYVVRFESAESAANIVKSYEPVEKIAKNLSDDGLRISLEDAMFEKGCFCLSPLASEHILVCSDKSQRAVEMIAPGVTHFQFWKMVGEPFLALEPWYGSITSMQPAPEESEWLRRRGTIFLDPEEEFICSYRIRIMR